MQKIPMKPIHFEEFKLTISVAEYHDNKRIAVLLMENSYTKYGTLSTNIPYLEIDENEFFVANWNHSEELLEKILESGVVQDTGKRCYGDAFNEEDSPPEASIWRLVKSN